MYYNLESLVELTYDLGKNKKEYFKRDMEKLINSNDYKEFNEYLMLLTCIDFIITQRYNNNALFGDYDISDTTTIYFETNEFKKDIINRFGMFTDEIDYVIESIFDKIKLLEDRIESYNLGLRYWLMCKGYSDEIKKLNDYYNTANNNLLSGKDEVMQFMNIHLLCSQVKEVCLFSICIKEAEKDYYLSLCLKHEKELKEHFTKVK